MTIHTADHFAAAPSLNVRSFNIARAIAAPFKAVAHALHKQRTVRELSRLDSRLLADIGIERGDIQDIAQDLTVRGYR